MLFRITNTTWSFYQEQKSDSSLFLLLFINFVTDFIGQAKENLGMAMMYTLATSAKEWLTEKFCGGDVEESEETEATEDEVCIFYLFLLSWFVFVCPWSSVFTLLANWPLILSNYAIIQVIVPHGEAVTVESFLAWRERFEAELALERAKYIITNN